MPAQERYEFEIEQNGKAYRCNRVVTGKRVLTQVITVLGVGSKADSANYGSRGHPISTMEDIAGIIAHEILRDKGIH